MGSTGASNSTPFLRSFGRHFQGVSSRVHDPGLKPWAIFFIRFAASAAHRRFLRRATSLLLTGHSLTHYYSLLPCHPSRSVSSSRHPTTLNCPATLATFPRAVWLLAGFGLVFGCARAH